MKILVTGGTGVVGAAAIPALLGAGHEVRLLSRHAERDAPAFPPGVEPFTADIADPAPLRTAVGGCGCVLHIAGIVDEEPPDVTFEKINVEGTRHLVDAASRAGEPHFIYLSSLGADQGESEYHRSKRRAEEVVRRYPGRWTILRPGNVYGPGDETISMLLKMVRTLPAVPVVESGDQPFQPLWYADLGRVIAKVVDDPQFAGQTLELAGAEVTTTDEVVELLGELTARQPSRLPVPAWLAEVGAQALEAFGAAGKKLLQRAGMSAPINSAKLSMLLEGNVIPDTRRNALLTRFDLEPTPLQEGLAMLTELLPEQVPGEGVGAITQATYSAEILDTPVSAAELLNRVCERIGDVMPLEFDAERSVPERLEEGATLTAAIPGRGHAQVRLEERTAERVTFVSLEGHPLAGVMQLHAEDIPGGVRFSVHTASQPSNAFDWLAMKTVGEAMQRQNWRAVVRRVVKLSGGQAPAGVTRSAHRMGSQETRDLDVWMERLVQRQQSQRAEALTRD